MTVEEFDERGLSRSRPGFRTYADDAPRFADEFDAADYAEPDWYDPFEVEAPAAIAKEPAPATRRVGPALLLSGGVLFAALAVGAAVRWPELSAIWTRHDAPPPAAGATQLAIQLRQEAPAQAPRPVAADPSFPSAQATPVNALPIAPRAELGDPAPPRPLPSPVAAQSPRAFVADPPPVVARPAPAAPPPIIQPALGRPVIPHVPGALDCANVVSPAQDAVCHDPGLMAAERRMARAYAEALAAGAPEGRLRRDQVDWLNMREDAALESRQAVESIYRQRIRDLEAEADAPPP